eukprot:5595863-Amphidinium_carterae.1
MSQLGCAIGTSNSMNSLPSGVGLSNASVASSTSVGSSNTLAYALSLNSALDWGAGGLAQCASEEWHLQLLRHYHAWLGGHGLDNRLIAKRPMFGWVCHQAIVQHCRYWC